MDIRVKRALLVVVCMLAVFFVVYFSIPEPIDLTVETEGQRNYNNYTYQNYIGGNYIDCNNGNIIHKKGWVLSRTTLQTVDGVSVMYGIDSPFQLTDEYIYYCQFRKLKQKSLATQEVVTIASKVEAFIALDDAVYYLSGDTFGHQLSKYDLCTKSNKSLCDNIDTIYYHNDHVYALDVDGHLLQFNESGTSTEVYTFDIPHRPFYIQFQGDCVLYENSNRFYFVNLTTKEVQIVALVDSMHANDRITYICDDNDLFVSYQATATNGSFVKDVPDDANGVWRVDPQTLEKEKLCDETFESLFLFSNDLLIGARDRQWYCISTENGQITRL